MTRDVLVIAGGRLLSAVLALIALRVSTTVLSSAEFGYMALMLGAQTLSTLVVINPVGQWINRHTHAWWDEGSLAQRLRAYRPWVVGASLLSASAFAMWALQQTGQWPGMASIAVAAAVVAAVYNGTYVPLLNMLGHRKQFVLLSNVSVALGLVCSVLFTWHTASAPLWLLGQATGLAVGAVLARSSLPRHQLVRSVSGPPVLISRADYAQFCIPLALSTACMWIVTAGWRFVGEHYWGLEALGQLYVALTLTLQIWTLAESLLMQVLIPLFYRGLEGQGRNGMGAVFSQLINAQLPIYLLLLGATVLSSKALLLLFVGPAYHAASSVVLLAAFVEFFRVVSNVVGNAAQATRQTRYLIAPYGLAVLTLMALLLGSGLLKMPVEFAVISLAVAGLVLFIALSHQMKKLLDWSIHWSGLGIPALFAGLALLAVPWLPPVQSLFSGLLQVAWVGTVATALAVHVLKTNPGLKALLQIKLRGP
ncbi:MAG TPA: hypothetical protein VGE55_00890 [Limnobacter sp.]|uniref:lipopolysaccharide biosynthesis protein n=1 Tax=Limnobacter sp. TaxID=2003368 RepID=UPI002EDB3325